MTRRSLGALLERGSVVVVEGVVGGFPRAFTVQGQDARGRWKLKLLGNRNRKNLGNQKHGVTVLIDGQPWTVTGHNGNHLRVEPIEVGVRAERRRAGGETTRDGGPRDSTNE